MSNIHVKLGEVLKLERENRKIDLETASDQLKISVEYLQYVENGEIDQAPSELYFGLFAKSYAELLGIDYSATMEAIKEEFGELEPEPLKAGTSDSKESKKEKRERVEDDEEPVDEEEKARKSKKMLGWIGIGLAGIIIGLLVWILVFGDGNNSTGLSTSSGQTSEEGLEAAETKQANDMVANYEFGTPPTESPAPIHLRMIPTEQCWSTVYADGDTAIYRTLNAGRQYDVDANYRLEISIAHPRFVRTWINGTEVDLRNPESGRIYRTEVTQINLDEVLKPRQIEEPARPTSNTTVPPAPKPAETVLTDPVKTGTTPPAVQDTTAPNEDSIEQL